LSLLLALAVQEPQDTSVPVRVTVDTATVRFPVAEGLRSASDACKAVFEHWWAGLPELPRYTARPGRVESMKALFLPDEFPDAFFEAYEEAEVPFRRASEYEPSRPPGGVPNGDYFWRCSDLEPLPDGSYSFSASIICGVLCGSGCGYEAVPGENGWAVARIGFACSRF
jgi:hypothetical protein